MNKIQTKREELEKEIKEIDKSNEKYEILVTDKANKFCEIKSELNGLNFADAEWKKEFEDLQKAYGILCEENNDLRDKLNNQGGKDETTRSENK